MAAHSSADPRAISNDRRCSAAADLPWAPATFSGIYRLEGSHRSRAWRGTPMRISNFSQSHAT